jgi:hypothetical protein
MIRDNYDLNHKMGLLHLQDDDNPIEDDKVKLLYMIYQMSLYFTSSNNVPVEKASIKTEDFCKITGISINELVVGD